MVRPCDVRGKASPTERPASVGRGLNCDPPPPLGAARCGDQADGPPADEDADPLSPSNSGRMTTPAEGCAATRAGCVKTADARPGPRASNTSIEETSAMPVYSRKGISSEQPGPRLASGPRPPSPTERRADRGQVGRVYHQLRRSITTPRIPRSSRSSSSRRARRYTRARITATAAGMSKMAFIAPVSLAPTVSIGKRLAAVDPSSR